MAPGAAGYFRVVFKLFRLSFLQEQRFDLLGGSGHKQNIEYSIFVLCGCKVEKVTKKRLITVWPHFLVGELFPLFCKSQVCCIYLMFVECLKRTNCLDISTL